MKFEAWGSHRYMNDNTCFGTFDTEEEARAAIGAKLAEDRETKCWTHVWVRTGPSPRVPEEKGNG